MTHAGLPETKLAPPRRPTTSWSARACTRRSPPASRAAHAGVRPARGRQDGHGRVLGQRGRGARPGGVGVPGPGRRGPPPLLAPRRGGARPRRRACPGAATCRRRWTRCATRCPSARSPCVLVLDDFHEVDGCEVAADLDRLLAQAPPALRLVLVTRQDPPLRLARLRLTDGLSEIRQRHLAFSEHEAAAAAQARGRDAGRARDLDALPSHRGLGRGAAAGGALAARPSRARGARRRPRRVGPDGGRLSPRGAARPPAPDLRPSCCGPRSSTPSPATWPTRSPKAATAPPGWRTSCGATRW